jgi:hypothetical protein
MQTTHRFFNYCLNAGYNTIIAESLQTPSNWVDSKESKSRVT